MATPYQNIKEQQRRKDVLRFFLLLILLVLWMGFIFCMSANNGSDSQGLSDKVARFIAPLFWPDFYLLSTLEQTAALSSLSFPIRKAAHFSEYAVLGFLSLAMFIQLRAVINHRRAVVTQQRQVPNKSFTKPAILAVLFSFLYACSDEFHQLFVDGRSGQPFDVMIDSTGALFGVAVTVLILVCHSRKKRKKLLK